MKILITYFSQTGNTKRIAEAIYEEISHNHETELKAVKKVKVENLDNYDLVFIGSACHDTDLAKPILRFLKKIPKSPKFKVAGFFTHATTPPEKDKRDNSLFEQWAGNCIKTFEKFEKEKQIDYKGHFRCQGLPSPPIEKFIHQTIIKDENEWKEYLTEVTKHPNTLDIENAKKFARDILNNL